jgi:hypothetical protein
VTDHPRGLLNGDSQLTVPIRRHDDTNAGKQ